MDEINTPEIFKMKHTLTKIQLLQAVKNDIADKTFSVNYSPTKMVRMEDVERVIDKWIGRCET